jgi:hypothetical protein
VLLNILRIFVGDEMKKKQIIIFFTAILLISVYFIIDSKRGNKAQMLFNIPSSQYIITMDHVLNRHFWLDSNHILSIYYSNQGIEAQTNTISGQSVKNKILTQNLSDYSHIELSSICVSSKTNHILLKGRYMKFLIGDLDFKNPHILPFKDLNNTYSRAIFDFTGEHAMLFTGELGAEPLVTSCSVQGVCSPPTQQHGYMYTYYQYIGTLENGWLMGITNHVGDGDLTVLQADMHNPPQWRNIFFLKTPPDVYGRVSAQVSPDGKQVAWVFGEVPPFLGISALNQTQFMRAQHINIQSVWISGSSGENMHKIYEETAADGAFTDINWSPDQRWISYIEDNAIWRIPVK